MTSRFFNDLPVIQENDVGFRKKDRFIYGEALHPPKTNMEPENGGLEDDFPFLMGDFQVPAVSFRGSTRC